MGTDVSAIIAELPEWLKVGANAALFVITALGGIHVYNKSRKEEAAKPEEHFDADDLLESSIVKTFINNIQVIADNIKLQTEALKNISAASTVIGKTLEEDYDERRVSREVDRRLAEEKMRRDMRS